jgi:Flp pilus assembly protein TadD
MGVVAAALGLLDLAAQALSFAVTAQPRSAVYRANLGSVLVRQSKFGEAETLLRSSLELEAGNAEVMSNLGIALAGQGRDVEAVESCRSAVATGEPSAAAQFCLGFVLAKVRQDAEARACYQAALVLDPTFSDAKVALAALDESAP